MSTPLDNARKNTVERLTRKFVNDNPEIKAIEEQKEVFNENSRNKVVVGNAPTLPVTNSTGVEVPTNLDNINDVPTIAPRTYGDYNGNALPIIGDALHTVGKGAIDLATTVGTGYQLIGKTLTGKEVTGNELDNNLTSVHDTLGLDTTFYRDMYSSDYKEYLAKQDAIGNSGNSQFTNYKDQLKLYRDNLGYAGLDATKTALQSGIEMLIGTKALQGVRGLTTSARVFGSSAIPEIGHYIGQEKAEGNKVDSNTITNALGSAAVVGGTELLGGKLFGHGNLENLTDALMQGTRVRGSTVKNMGTDMLLEGGLQEPIQNAVGTALHNYENNRDLSEGQGQGLAQSQVLGTASAGIMSTPANIGVAVRNGTDAGKALVGKANSAIRQKAAETSTEGAGNVANLTSGKYDPVRAISDNISVLNSDTITMDDVTTANNNVVQIRANALAHIHELQEKIESAESEEEATKYINELSDFNTNYWKPLETQNKLAKQAFKNIAGKLEQDSTESNETSDEFVQNAADNFVNLLRAPAGTYVDPQVAAQTNDAAQRATAPISSSSQGISTIPNGLPNTMNDLQVRSLGFTHEIKQGAIKGNVQGDTVAFAKLVDQDGLGGFIKRFSAFNDGSGVHASGKQSHGTGYKFDLSLKQDTPQAYAAARKRMIELANAAGYEVVVTAEHPQGAKQGLEGFAWYKNSTGSHLDVRVVGRTNGNSQGGTLSTGRPAVSGVKSLVAVTVAKESAGGDYNIANYDKGGVAKGVRVTEFTLERLMSNADGLNAAGKYQVITPTLRSAVKELGLNPKLKFTPEVQEQIAQWLYFKKNPTLASYIKGGNVSVEDALDDLSTEWQAIGNRNGLISIGSTKGRRAHVQPAEVIPSLQAARQAYAQAKAQGMSDSQAEVYAINNGTTLSGGTGSSGQTSNTGYQQEIDKQNRRISDLEDELAKATDNNNQEQIDSLTAQIDELKQQMVAQQEQVQGQEQASTEQVESASPEAQAESVQAKKELPPEVVEQQEIVVQQAIQRARANNLTAQHVDTLEQSGAITQTHAQELRVMLDNQRILTAANTANDVNNEVINGRKRDRSIDSMVGLNNYADVLDTAIDTGDTKTLGKFMSYLERFAANRSNKSTAINEALLQNPSNDNPIYVVPDKSGNWRVESGLVKGNQELFKAGAFQVWQNNNTNNAVAEESKLTNDLLNNYQQIITLRQQNGLLSDFTQQATQPTHNTQVKPSKFADDPLLVNTKGTEAIELTEFEQGKVKEHQATYDKQLSDWSLDDFSNVGVTISDVQDSTGSREVSDSDLAIVKDTITQGIKEGKSSLDIINSVQAALAKQGKTIKLGQLSNLETYIKYQQSLNKGSTASSTTLDETKAGNKNKDGKLHQPKKGSRVRIDGTNVVYQNQADSVDYKLETNNEILVGREYEFSTKTNTKSGKPSLKPTANSGLAIFTKDGKLATGESAKGKFFDLSRINEPGALGNPFTSLSSAQTITDENGKQVPNSWYVKNRQAEIIAYINLLKHFATSTKDDRMAFLEVLPQLTGKLLVTDFYHQEEALFIDYLVKGLDKVTRTSRKNDSRQDRIDANEVAREWVERITYELVTDGKGNRKIEFSQDNTTPLEELIANRKSGQKPKKPIIDETSDEIIEVDESKVTDNEVEVEEISTDDDTTVSTGVFDLGEDDTADTKDALEDAPEVMLSRAEKAAQANQQEDESLEEALERTNTEFNLDKPQVIHKILDKLMLANALAGFGNQDEETNNYFKEMILALTNYLDDPKVVINDKAVIPTFNGETNTVEVKLSENLLRDIASALIRQSTLDIADEVNNYSIKDYRELSEDAKYQPGILTKDEIVYAKHIANINNKLQTVKEKIAASLETKVVDEGTVRLLSIMINGQLGSVLSIGLTNGKVREFLSSVTYKPNKKATRTSLFKYLLNALQEFIGVKPKYENVLETLLSIQGDIAEVKLLKSDFNSTEDAKLSAFNITEEELASELNKPLDKRNRLLSSFTQSGKTTLSTVKDVANKLLQDPSKGVHFILGEPMTPEQRNQLDDFQEFKNSFVRYLKSSFAVQNKASDMKAYLYDSNGELDDNLVTALALSTYSWFIANGNKELNTFDDVKKLLAMDKDSDAILPARIYRDYKYMGNLSMFVASDLGKTAVAALGIDETADAKRFSKAELEMSLGNWVLSALQNTGMVTLLPMDREQHIKNMKAVGGKIPENVTNSNASELLFVTLKPGEEYSRHARIQEIIDSSKGARGFLSNLFKTDIGLRSPKYKQPTKVKSKIKKSKSIVSNLQATFINKMQSESIEIDVRTLDAVNTLLSNNGSWFRQLIGAEVTQSELNKMHINDRDSAEAAAEGLKRELETGLGFIAGLKRTGNTLQKFWDSIYVARNTRMHFNSNEFNMQTSLIHRMLGSYSNFKTTLSMDGITLDNLAEKALDTEGKPTKLGLFLSALAMNLEGTDSFIKAHTDVDLQAYTKDKVPSSIFMPAFVEWIAQDTIQRAVKAMQNVLNNKVGTNDLDAIKSFVDEGDMGIQSFRALVELANMLSAIENGTELTTSIGLGSDGINNGIALGSIYNGVANIRTMLQTGFIPKDSEFKNYLETRLDRSIGDYYEAYAEVLSETMGNLLNDVVFFADLQKKNIGEESINAIQEIQPAFNVVKFPKPARKLAKAIIIPFGYSAGIARLVQVAQETFIGDIQKQLTDLANEPNATKQTQLENNLRILLADETFELPSNPKDLLEFWFTPKQVNKLASTYEVIVGEAIDKSLNTFAGDFKAARERNIEMHEHTYQMYERVHNIIVNKALNELANQSEETPEEIAKRGFTNKEWDALAQPELDKVMPSLYTAFNTTANDIEIDDTIDPINDALSGIEVFKRGRKLVANKVKSFTRLATGDNKLESIQNTLPSMEEILEKIGVFVNSAQIQGTDGRISAAASAMLGLVGIVNLNIHDQNDGGLANYVKMVLTQNKATFDVLATNHLQLNSLETFMTMLDKYMNTLSELGLNVGDIVGELIAILGKHVGEESAYSLPSGYLEALFTLVRNTELTKLSTLQNLKAIQQYAGETGEYVVTDNDVKLAKDQEAIINERMTKLESSLSKYLSLEETITELVEPKQEPASDITSISDITLYSGGAFGADTLWDVVGRTFGITNANHYRAEDNRKLSTQLRQANVSATILSKEEIDFARNEVNKLLKTNFQDNIVGNLQARNYYQVVNSDGVYAIAPMYENKRGISGGTSTAVKLGIKMGKPVYVWDTNTRQWYKHNGKTFEVVDTPTLSKNPATVGTRDIELYDVRDKATGKYVPNPKYLGDDVANAAREAIKAVFANTVSAINPSQEGSQDTDGTSQSDGTDDTTSATQLGEINNPHSWIADLINKVVKGNAYNPGQIELMEYIFRRIKESGLTVDMVIVDEDTMRSLAYGQRELGIYLSGKIYLLDSHVNSGNDFAVAATVLHELLHQLTVDGIESTDPAVVRARNELERMFKHLKGKVAPTNNAHLDSIIDIVFNEPDVAELITYGITDPTFTQWMTRNLADFNKNKSGLSNPINELKRFLKVVSVYFKWDRHNDVLTPKPIKSLLKKDEASFEHFVRVVDSLTITISKSSTNEVSTTAPKANTIAATQLSNNGSSTAHDNHLDKVNDVIQAFKDSLPEREVAVNASSKNKTNDSLMNLLGLTDKESYTYESVKAVVETFLKTQGNNKTVRELLAIYKELQSGQITKENFVSNWGTATAQERNYAKSVYDQLFGANKSNQKQDHLVKFISLALTSEKFRKAISIKRNRIKTTDTNGIFGTLMGLFERIVNVFTNMVSNLSGKNVSEQVDTLFTKLTEIDARSRSNKLSGFELIWNAKGVITDASNKFARSTINKAIGSLPKDPRTFLGKIGTVVNKGVNEDLSKVVTQYLEMYSTYIQKTAVGRGKARYGEIRNLISDFGSNTQIKKVHDRLVMATQSIGRERQKIKDNTREGLLTKFSNNGANLTKEIREALTSMVLRTDLGSLLDYTNMHTVMSYFNETTRNNTIAALEKKIMGIPHGSHMIMQSKDLAKYMITDGGSDTLVKSAQGIAINQGTVYESDFKNMEESLYEDINTLTSLYALKYANDRHGYVFNSLIADEKEGIKALITLHSDIVKISKEDFNNNPYNYIKGYLPEITNPNRSLTWILEDQLEEYLAQGWERINEDLLPRDASDRSDNRILMYHKHIDYQDRVSGDLDLKDTHSKGYAVYTAADDYLDIMRVAKDKLARQQDREANQDPIAYNPFDNRSSFIPNFGADGAIINYHYEMEGFLRDQYLERNNDALELISVLNAKVQIKPKLQESQRNVARALYADYQRNYVLNPLAFVTMTPDSIDPKVVEDYALMPHVFREEAIKLFGKDMPIVVRASVYNTVFGFRTYSIGKMFDKVVNERNALEKILVRVFSSIPVYDANKKYKVSLANAKGKSIAVMLEDIIKALTGFSKDVIINRGYKVVLGNMISNILLLGIHGVDPITIAKDFTFAWQEGKRYNQAEGEKIKLEVRLQIETNPSEKARIRQAIVEKKAYMDRSKIKQYMEIGLMSTIVEDVSTLSDDLGYKTRYEEFVAPVTNHIPKAVKDTFGFLIMSPGTTMHNFISDANQFTDFAAKYTLAKHLQSKGTSFDEAIAVAQENFLNFDIPQGQGMDYMNKVGLFMFTKFFIRFQRVLTKLMLEKPAQLIAHQMMLDGLFDIPSVMQPYLLYNIGNPFDLGAVGMIGAADDMMLPSLFI